MPRLWARTLSNSWKTIGFLARMSMALALCGMLSAGGLAKAQAAPSRSQAATASRTAKGDSQRGEAIFYIKCNFCHAEIAKLAPSLKELYQRSKLVTGKPVNDEAVSEQIKNGSERMPSFRYSLNDAEVADLVSYLREGKCCPDPENPPANPQYRNR